MNKVFFFQKATDQNNWLAICTCEKEFKVVLEDFFNIFYQPC